MELKFALHTTCALQITKCVFALGLVWMEWTTSSLSAELSTTNQETENFCLDQLGRWTASEFLVSAFQLFLFVFWQGGRYCEAVRTQWWTRGSLCWISNLLSCGMGVIWAVAGCIVGCVPREPAAVALASMLMLLDGMGSLLYLAVAANDFSFPLRVGCDCHLLVCASASSSSVVHILQATHPPSLSPHTSIVSISAVSEN
jgi:hypothetical protein